MLGGFTSYRSSGAELQTGLGGLRFSQLGRCEQLNPPKREGAAGHRNVREARPNCFRTMDMADSSPRTTLQAQPLRISSTNQAGDFNLAMRYSLVHPDWRWCHSVVFADLTGDPGSSALVSCVGTSHQDFATIETNCSSAW